MTQARQTHSWMNQEIRRAIRQKQRAYRKSRKTGKMKGRYRKLQPEVQFKVKSAHKQYMQDVVSYSYKGNPKNF